MIQFVNDNEVVDENGPWDRSKVRYKTAIDDIVMKIAMDTTLSLRSGTRWTRGLMDVQGSQYCWNYFLGDLI